MTKHLYKQNVTKHSSGTAQKQLISLLPKRTSIHIASFVEDSCISLVCPFEKMDFENGFPKFIFSNGDSLVEGTKLRTVIDYPLSTKVEFEVELAYYVNDMIGAICKKYKEIYKEENETSKKKAMTLDEEFPGCGLLNRNETNGCYGIWGHNIGDLYIERLQLDTENKELVLVVGS